MATVAKVREAREAEPKEGFSETMHNVAHERFLAAESESVKAGYTLPFTESDIYNDITAPPSLSPVTFTDAVFAVVDHASAETDGLRVVDVPAFRPHGCCKAHRGRSLHCLPLRDADKIGGNKLFSVFAALLAWAGYKVVDENGAFSCTGGVGVTPVVASALTAAASPIASFARRFAAPLVNEDEGPLKCL